MQTRSLELPLRAPGAASRTARLEIGVLEPIDRVKRAAAAFGLGLVAAAVAVLIPIVHFVLVPGSFLAGLILAGVRLSQREIVLSAEGACPFCGTRQRLGLAGRKYRLPRRVHCSSCGQELDLDPIG